MPTFRHGKNTHFSIESAANVLTDVSNTLRDVSFPVTADVAETSAFGSTVKTYVVGLKDGRFTISGMFDATVDALLNGIHGLELARDFVYGPEGNASGRVRYLGEAFLTNYTVQGSIGDMVQGNCEFQVTGPITRNTFP